MFGGRFFGARTFGGRYFGKRGLVVDGAYFGHRHYGCRYFGKRYFGSNGYTEAFPLVQTAGISIAGAVGVAGGLAFGADFAVAQTAGIGLAGVLAATSGGFSFDGEVFYFTPPIRVAALSGTVGVSGAIVITAPAAGYGGHWGRRYFGARFYGPRYFGAPAAWRLTLTNTLGLTGALNVAGNVQTTITLAQTNALGLTGSLGVAAAFEHNGAEVIGRGLIDWRGAQIQQDAQAYSARQNIVAVLTALAATGVLD